jgi:hypothetical protein
MRLIECFTVIRVSAAANFISASEFHFEKPIRVSQRLTRHSDNIGVPMLQNLFSLLKRRDAAGGHNRGHESVSVDCVLDFGNQRHRTPKRAAFVRESRGHALVTALAGVRVNGLPDFGLFCILELAAF